jgi:hypothetical protein
LNHCIKHRAGPITDGAVFEHLYLIAAGDEAGVTVCEWIEERQAPKLPIANRCKALIEDEDLHPRREMVVVPFRARNGYSIYLRHSILIKAMCFWDAQYLLDPLPEIAVGDALSIACFPAAACLYNSSLTELKVLPLSL